MVAIEIVLFLVVIFPVTIVGLLFWRKKGQVGEMAALPRKICLVMGSGGHTTELLRLTGALDWRTYASRMYIIADTDHFSEAKVTELESGRGEKLGSFKIYKIPRSREVRQSFLTAIYSTIKALLFCFPLFWNHRPDVVLVNGPGTCIPACGVVYLFRLFRILHPWTQIIFVESICRVETLSLTGKLLYHLRMADHMLVQWPQLLEKYDRLEFIGRLS